MQFTISSARLEPAAEAQVEDANRPDGRLEVPGNSRQTKLEHLQLTTGLSTPSASSPAFFSGFPAARASSAKKSSDSGCFFLRPRLALKTSHSPWRSSAQKLLSGAFSSLFFSSRRRAGTFQRVSVARPQGRNRKNPPVQTSSLSPSPEAPPGPRQERGLDPDCGKALDIGGKQRQTGGKHHSGRAGLTSKGNNDGGGRRTNF